MVRGVHLNKHIDPAKMRKHVIEMLLAFRAVAPCPEGHFILGILPPAGQEREIFGELAYEKLHIINGKFEEQVRPIALGVVYSQFFYALYLPLLGRGEGNMLS
jgi:hypothetical protein